MDLAFPERGDGDRPKVEKGMEAASKLFIYDFPFRRFNLFGVYSDHIAQMQSDEVPGLVPSLHSGSFRQTMETVNIRCHIYSEAHSTDYSVGMRSSVADRRPLLSNYNPLKRTIPYNVNRTL